MGKSQETFGKKEKEKKRLKQRQDKQEKMDERKANAKKGKSLNDMLAYIDENGNLSSSPPDPKKMKAVMLEDIQIGIPKQEDRPVEDLIRKGVVTFFNDDKGFGFINDLASQERVFVHVKQLSEPLRENDKVTFEVEMGPKGMSAVNVVKTS
jgi:cold shock CspA family protein